ncbi:dihydrofolate reductase family protein [Haloechinothrix sp. LS1_15]|uniref:RibD family protein n=1 Tax=Haloechinothrix sp. LS1_15 TaxID=2652248 RepID=UPI002944BA95|nr:dihydrofolate reductase family protein [Haloechinothrix sp. LS1_15]MDV6012336.1 deaminase [Haloechinothrix sp. LS1_15]
MSPRPYILLSVAASLDGYIDDTTTERLILSNEEDLDRVDEVRAGVDAILVGAGTVRTDNPRLLVRSPQRRQQRVEEGKPEQPTKVTLTASADLDPGARFFTAGGSDKIVYATSAAAPRLDANLAGAATVVNTGAGLDLDQVLADLASRGIGRLMVEGGAHVHARFLGGGHADELQLAYAPVFVGDSDAPRLTSAGPLRRRLQLAESRVMGDVVLLRYLMAPAED